MEKEFGPYGLAVKLKSLGFNEPCFRYYLPDKTFVTSEVKRAMPKQTENCICAPTFSQAFRFFREEYGLDSFCRQTNLDGTSYYQIRRIENDEIIKGYSIFSKTYEEAELACLTKLIEIVDTKTE